MSPVAAAVLVAMVTIGMGRVPHALASNPSFTYNDFSSTSGLQLNGNAATATSPLDTTALRLTPASLFQAGSAFYTTPIDTTKSFHTQFAFYLHDSEDTGYGPADGFTFVVQNDSRGTEALGDAGGALGYGDNDEAAITPSIAVGFNTYSGSSKPPLSILENGSAFTYHASASPSFSLYGAPYYAWIDYYATAHVLAVYVSATNSKPSTPFISYSYDIAASVGTTAYVGFTGGTGAGDQDEDILSWQFAGGTPSYSYPAFGAFVLGDAATANALAGPSGTAVTYWSPIWSRVNLLKSEPQTFGPATFKGFASSLSSHPPVCGGTWTVPAAYSVAPPSTVPTFMAVIVASHITQNKGVISGNITRIVIVDTGSAYNYRNGRPATGIVADTLCGP
jgi:hypothetical protein